MITTIKIKDLIRYFFCVRSNSKNKNFEQSSKEYTFLSCIKIAFPILKTMQTENPTNNEKENTDNTRINNTTTSRSGLVRILGLELLNVGDLENDENQNENSDVKNASEKESPKNVEKG